MAELAISSVSLALQLITHGRALRQLIADADMYLDDVQTLDVQINAEIAKAETLKDLLFGEDGGDAEGGSFSSFDDTAQESIYECMAKARALIETEGEALRGAYSRELRGAETEASREQQSQVLSGPQLSLERVANWNTSIRWAWSGRRRTVELIADFAKWNRYIWDLTMMQTLKLERRPPSQGSAPEALRRQFRDEIETQRRAMSAPDSQQFERLLFDAGDIPERRTSGGSPLSSAFYRTNHVYLEDTLRSDDYSEKHTPAEIRSRACQLAAVLGLLSPSDACVFPCIGLIPRQGRYSLVFRTPEAFIECTPISLYATIEQCQRTRARPQAEAQPSLGDRLRLAHRLAFALHRMHVHGQLHKGLRSSRIFIFRNSDSDMVNSAFVFGFEYSRTESTRSLHSPLEQIRMNVYRHPGRWGNPSPAFTRRHDIYALGVLLMEIGLWRTVPSLLKWRLEDYEDMHPVAVKDELVRCVDKYLPAKAGNRYTEVVKACLEGGFAARGEGIDEALRVGAVQALAELAVAV